MYLLMGPKKFNNYFCKEVPTPEKSPQEKITSPQRNKMKNIKNYFSMLISHDHEVRDKWISNKIQGNEILKIENMFHESNTISLY